VIKALKEGRFPNRVMMTTHPQRWADGLGEWLKELVMQKLKNIIKRFLIVNF
jgi:hypothetical protein